MEDPRGRLKDWLEDDTLKAADVDRGRKDPLSTISASEGPGWVCRDTFTDYGYVLGIYGYGSAIASAWHLNERQ